MKYKAKEEQQLMNLLLSPELAEDPLEFVRFVYPWKKKGTPLENYEGPRGWQRECLEEIKIHIKDNKNLVTNKQTPIMLQDATVSGRGVGKSALVGWLNHWHLSCHIGGTAITTANTEKQLKSRTWAELGKWHTLALNSHWFITTSTSMIAAPWFEKIVKEDLSIDTGYYYAQAQAWSEENPDAFAGVHNPHGLLLIYDEASGIPRPIWDVSEGFFTEPDMHRYWFAFSNGRRNTGAFYECFHKNRNYWRNRHIDARTVEGTDPAVYQKIIDQYGEDSDVVRVEVKGQFPSQGDSQFIANSTVDEATERDVPPCKHEPIVMGVDVARFGDDKSVIRLRQGRDAKTFPVYKFKNIDNMQLAYKVAELINEWNPEAVNIDAGNGSGVIDRLRELGYKVNEIWFGSKSSADSEYYNKRTQMWGDMRNWLGGGCIDDDQELRDDLTGPEYRFAGRDGDKIILESKDEMKKRGEASPDDGDALALTFAVPVAKRNLNTASRNVSRRPRVAEGVEGDLFNF